MVLTRHIMRVRLARHIRQNHNSNQSEFARSIGVSKEEVSRVINERVEFPSRKIMRFMNWSKISHVEG